MKLRKIVNNQEIIDSKYTEILLRYLPNITEDKLAENYQLSNLMLNKHLSFDCIFTQDDEIVAFCGIFNGGRYPENVHRILNRTYVSPIYRNNALNGGYFCTQHILPYQLQQYNLDTVFVSVEGRKGYPYLQQWVKHAPARDSIWRVSDKLYQVSDARNQGCYQYIAVNGDFWTDDTVTYEEWMLLPGK